MKKCVLKLACQQDPRVLGIENAQGKWNTRALAEHLSTCGICRKADCEKAADAFNERMLRNLRNPDRHKD